MPRGAAAPKIPLLEHLAQVPDPRASNRKYSLSSILAMAIVAVVCEADSWEDIASDAELRRDWYEEFLDLPGSTPSPDTFARVFSLLSPDAISKSFAEWTKSLAPCLPLWTPFDVVAVDGKTVRGSKWSGGPAAHMVSAWSSANGICMASVRADVKSNEITAIPKLLDLLELKGSVVTLDAMGCQETIAKHIVAAGADYILALKDNQKNLRIDVELAFSEEQRRHLPYRGKVPKVVCEHHTTVDHGHGRVDTRVASVITDAAQLEYLEQQHHWPHLKAIGKVTSTRKFSGKKAAVAERFYLLSQPLSAEHFNAAVRAHWGVENQLHYVMDVVFADDSSRAKVAAENLSRIRHMALNLLKLTPHPRITAIRRRRRAALVQPKYLREVLVNAVLEREL